MGHTCNSITINQHDVHSQVMLKDNNPPPLSITLNLTPTELRNTNPVESILNMLTAVGTHNGHRSTLHTILSELYNNALEHGLLKLDSTKKTDAERFAEYYMDREERLLNLQEGFINITIDVNYQNNETLYSFSVTDSGNGFTYMNREFNADYHGRGLRIVNELCNSLDFSNDGRTVKVIYRDKRAMQ